MNIKQTTRHLLAATGLAMGLALTLSGAAHADANQLKQCKNECTRIEGLAHEKCDADYKATMQQCTQMPDKTKDEKALKKQCIRNANQTQKDCHEKARADRKQCHAQCEQQFGKR